MRIVKRIFLFGIVNILIVLTLSVLLSVLGLTPRLSAQGFDWATLAAFCAVWGFGGAFLSLAMSRIMAKLMTGTVPIDDNTRDAHLIRLRARVHELARNAGLQTMPEVGVYPSDELNAFATGPTRNRALVAVSTGLLERMSDEEVDGVLAHEVAHVANGDMVTMTLAQGVVNAFVMFLARIVAFFAGQWVEEEKRPAVQFGVVLALEIGLGILGMLVVSAFSRAREFRADAGGARLAGRRRMVAALEALRAHQRMEYVAEDQPALATLKIHGRGSRFLQLFSTHPDLDDRIARLRDSRESELGSARTATALYG